MTCDGKSRSLYELRRIIHYENISFIGKKSPSCSSRVAYHLIIAILKPNFNILNIEDFFKFSFFIHHLSTIHKLILKLPIFCLYEAFPFLIEAES